MWRWSFRWPRHEKKKYRWRRGIAPPILNLSTRRKWVVNFTPRPFSPREGTAVLIEQDTGWASSRWGRFWRREICLASPGIPTSDRPARSLVAMTCSLWQIGFGFFKKFAPAARTVPKRKFKFYTQITESRFPVMVLEVWKGHIRQWSCVVWFILKVMLRTSKAPQKRQSWTKTGCCRLIFSLLRSVMISRRVQNNLRGWHPVHRVNLCLEVDRWGCE